MMNAKIASKVMTRVALAILTFNIMIAQVALARPATDDDNFATLIRQNYPVPEFFQDNDHALQMRIWLLQNAPANSKVKILTFHFVNGESTRRLAAEMCEASMRGVHVQFMADSKTGDRPGFLDFFDKGNEHQTNEEIYQYLANCKVDVRIHNHIPFFSVRAGMKIPYFAYEANGALAIKNAMAISKGLERFNELLKETFADMKIDPELENDPNVRAIIDGLKEKFDSKDSWYNFSWFNYIQNIWALAMNNNKELPVQVAKDFRLIDLLDDLHLFTAYGPELKERVALFQKRLSASPEMANYFWQIRRANRLNHRKLFYVESSAGNGCVLVGGRNLGDHYLTNHDDSFLDSDILFCTHHDQTSFEGLSQSESILKRAAHSFDTLANAFTIPTKDYRKARELLIEKRVKNYIPDNNHVTPEYYQNVLKAVRKKIKTIEIAAEGLPLVHPRYKYLAQNYVYGNFAGEHDEGNLISLISPDFTYQFRYLMLNNRVEHKHFSSGVLRNDQAALENVGSTDPEKHVSRIPQPRRAHVVHGIELENTFGWRFLITDWWRHGLGRDEVRQHLYAAIDREQQEIYIESAYAELEEPFRLRLEAALKRGVKLTIITNSFHMSDGVSGLIRILMAPWTREMIRLYPSQFEYKVARVQTGHMIHFKGAAFRCQKYAENDYRKTFIIGSHNFHARSGFDDKEHAVTWNQPIAEKCLAQVSAQGASMSVATSEQADLIDYRREFYSTLDSDKFGGMSVLEHYPSLYDELTAAYESGQLTPGQAKLVRIMQSTLFAYSEKTGRHELRGNEHTYEILRRLRNAGVHDLLGKVF